MPTLPDQIGSPKTLWDWLDLLIIPLALALIAYNFRKSEVQSIQEETENRNREQALNTFFQHIQEILLSIDLSEPESKKNASVISSARTHALLRSLDPERKSLLLNFLNEAKLINGYDPFISLRRADLSRSIYKFSSLSDVNFKSVNLEKASFENVNLSNSQLTGSNLFRSVMVSVDFQDSNLEYSTLDEANFYRSNLKGSSLIKSTARKADFSSTNFENAKLRDVDFYKSNLRKANLRGAYLKWSQFEHANLEKADLRDADLTEANLTYANLKGANLSGAKLIRTIVTRAQLKKTKSMKGAIIEDIQDRLGPPRMLSPLHNNDEEEVISNKEVKPPSWFKKR